MTTYTLTQVQVTKLHDYFHSIGHTNYWSMMRSLKPNSQEPVAEVHEYGRSISVTEIKKGVLAHGQKLFLHPAPISKEDMVKVSVVIKRYLNETPLGHQPHMITDAAYEAITIMQQAIEGMK